MGRSVRRVINGIAMLVIVAAPVACSAPDASAGWEGTVAQVGDTTIVTTLRAPVDRSVRLDAVTILWRSDSLDVPWQVLVAGPATLAVADRDRIFTLSPDGAVRAILGRQGDGPGEFRRLGAIGARGDTIVGLDRTNRNFTRFHADGAVLSSGVLRPAGELVNLMPARIGLDDGGIVVHWNDVIRGEGIPSGGGVVRHPWAEESAVVVARMAGQPYVFTSTGGAGRATMFGPAPIIGVSRDGDLALTDGVEYCLDVVRPHGTPMRICRDWKRVPVSAAVRTPDWDTIVRESGRPAESFATFRELLGLVTIPSHRNAIDRVFWDAAGRLWVQVVDESAAEVHPYLSRFAPDRLPSHVRWDLFAPDGRLAWELALPRTFTPTDATDDRVVGIYETPEGDLAAAAIALPGGGSEK